MKGESIRAPGQKAPHRPLLTAVATGILLSLVLGSMSFLSTAAGHGTYIPVALFFPTALLLAIKQTMISDAALVLAATQWPLYGAALGLAAGRGRQKAVMICLTVVHAALVIACFLLDVRRQYL